MDEAAHRVRRDEAQKPEHEQNNEYSPKHRFPLYGFPSVRARAAGCAYLLKLILQSAGRRICVTLNKLPAAWRKTAYKRSCLPLKNRNCYAFHHYRLPRRRRAPFWLRLPRRDRRKTIPPSSLSRFTGRGRNV